MSENSNIYYSKRIQPLNDLYAKIKDVCKRHCAVKGYRVGDDDTVNIDKESFPFIHLETIMSATETENKKATEYSIALNIIDLKEKEASEEQVIQRHDSCKQILDEIKAYFQQKKSFGTTNVGEAQYLIFNDGDFVKVRAEYTLTVERMITDANDLKQIFGEV